MKVSFAENRVTVSFRIRLSGAESINVYNNILSIANKYNAQVNIYENKPAYLTLNDGSSMPQKGDFGGSVTFHSDSCNPKEDYKILFNYIRPYAISVEFSKEAVVTHRADGSPYKTPQIEIVSCDSNGD